MLAFLARTPTRKRFPHCTVYECLKAFFRHASVFKTHRHAVYHCLENRFMKGVFSGRKSLESQKCLDTARIYRKWSDSPLFCTVWGFSRISEFSRIFRHGPFSKDAFSRRPLFRTRFSAFWPFPVDKLLTVNALVSSFLCTT